MDLALAAERKGRGGGVSLGGGKGQAAQSLEVQMETPGVSLSCRWLPCVGFNLEESMGIRQTLTVQIN